MLSQNIKNLRKQNGYTQETLAAALGVVRQTVSKWEKGYSVPDAVTLEKMSELFEVPVGALLGEAQQDPEEKSDVKKISEQLSILNDQFAKELTRKRRNRKTAVILLAAVAALIALAFIASLISIGRNVADPDSGFITPVSVSLEKELEEAVGGAALAQNPDPSADGECPVESHFVFGTKEKNGTVKVYLLEDRRVFGFKNGFFTDVSGSAVPAVYSFEKTGGGYKLKDRQAARDGGEYLSSIEDLFPDRYVKMILHGLTEEQSELMWKNQAAAAKAYLDSIGRSESVAKYGDIETLFLSDFGVTPEAQNRILEMKFEFDVTFGNHERLENGKRFVYQTGCDEEEGLVTFTKFEYETGRITEYIAVDGTTGETIKNAEPPKSVEYFRGAASKTY